MGPEDALRVANYLKYGGRIVKVKATVPVTEQELLEYLATRGTHPKYQHGDAKPYVHNNQRFSLEGLVRLANCYREAQKLPPFALRVDALSWRR